MALLSCWIMTHLKRKVSKMPSMKQWRARPWPLPWTELTSEIPHQEKWSEFTTTIYIHFQAVQGQREEPCGEGCVVGGVCCQEWDGGWEAAQAHGLRGALVHLPPPGPSPHPGHHNWPPRDHHCEPLPVLCQKMLLLKTKRQEWIESYLKHCCVACE